MELIELAAGSRAAELDVQLRSRAERDVAGDRDRRGAEAWADVGLEMDVAGGACDAVAAERAEKRGGAAGVDLEQAGRIGDVVPEVHLGVAADGDAQPGAGGV